MVRWDLNLAVTLRLLYYDDKTKVDEFETRYLANASLQLTEESFRDLQRRLGRRDDEGVETW